MATTGILMHTFATMSPPPPLHALHEEGLVHIFLCTTTNVRLVVCTHGTSAARGPDTPVHRNECSFICPRGAIRQGVNQRWSLNRTWGQWAAYMQKNRTPQPHERTLLTFFRPTPSSCNPNLQSTRTMPSGLNGRAIHCACRFATPNYKRGL